jgi:hypothetical protein
VLFETGLNYPISVDLTPGDNVIRQHVETVRGDGSTYSPVLPTGVRPEQGEWHHLAISYTFDPDAPYTLGGETYYGRGTQQIYVNGVPIGAPVVTDGVLRDTTFARIGIRRGTAAAGTTGTALDGMMDDTALWGRSLDARTIAAIAGLGHVSGVSLNDYTAIENVLALSAVGQSAAAGSDTWHYANAMVAPAGGGSFVVGRNYEGVDGNHYIVLDGSYKSGFTGVATGAPSLIGGLTAYWDFNEAAGQTAVKNSNLAAGLAAGREALDGTLLNDVALAAGKFGNAVSLPGQPHNYVNVASQVVANGQEEYTLSMWFSPSEIGSRRQVLFETGGSYAMSAGLAATTNRVQHYVETTGSTPSSTTTFQPAEDEWYHLAITYAFDAGLNQGTSKIYIDGVEYTGNQLTSIGELASTTFARIGAHRSDSDAWGTGFCFAGLIDDTAIWSRALDGRAIAAVAGLGALAGLDLNGYGGIDAVLALDGLGQSAAAGNLTWNFTDTFENLPDGQSLVAGMNYIGTDGHYYIVLGGSAQQGFTGVWAVPEPGTFGLLLTGLLGLLTFGRRQR